jgi:hypothetical protein
MKLDAAVEKVIVDLRVADAKTVGDVLSTKHEFKNPHSARVQAQKHLNLLVETGQLMRGDGWYAVKGYRGEFKDHDRLLTQALAEILKLKYEADIRREVSFESGLRSDAVVLLKKEKSGLCIVLEVALSETPEYLNQKVVAWRNWPGANQALSELFGIPIPYFTLVVSGKTHPEAIEFNEFLEEVKQ